jgi:hypothetical protein
VSYDISLYMLVDTGATEPHYVELAEVGNYTSNVAPMWTDALGHRLSELKEKNAGDSLPALERAVAALEAAPAKYETMNPANGWGDYEGAVTYLRRLRDACAAHPKATIHIWH